MHGTADAIDRTSPSEAKIALFRSLFRGREDEDVGRDLDLVLDTILRAIAHGRGTLSVSNPLVLFPPRGKGHTK